MIFNTRPLTGGAAPVATLRKADVYELLEGNGLPANALGENGDWYINKTDSKMYGPKAGGVWPTTASTNSDILANAAAIAIIETEQTTQDTALATETTARTAADTALDTRVTANTTDIAALQADGGLAQEVTDRTDADTALDARVTDNEADVATNAADIVTLTAAGTAATAALAAEAVTRAADDTALDVRVTANTDALAQEVTDRTAAVAQEVTDRTAADAQEVLDRDAAIAAQTFADHADVTVTAPEAGHVLVRNAANDGWENKDVPAGSVTRAHYLTADATFDVADADEDDPQFYHAGDSNRTLTLANVAVADVKAVADDGTLADTGALAYTLEAAKSYSVWWADVAGTPTVYIAQLASTPLGAATKPSRTRTNLVSYTNVSNGTTGSYSGGITRSQMGDGRFDVIKLQVGEGDAGKRISSVEVEADRWRQLGYPILIVGWYDQEHLRLQFNETGWRCLSGSAQNSDVFVYGIKYDDGGETVNAVANLPLEASVVPGDVLALGTNEIVKATGGTGGAALLDELTDVDTTTVVPQARDVFQHDGTNFVPKQAVNGLPRTWHTVPTGFVNVAAVYANEMVDGAGFRLQAGSQFIGHGDSYTRLNDGDVIFIWNDHNEDSPASDMFSGIVTGGKFPKQTITKLMYCKPRSNGGVHFVKVD